MTCPLCSRRPAKRPCPALGQTICATCCATKRLVEIRCPDDCAYLGSARRHPAAMVRRQQEADLMVLMGAMGRRPTDRQVQLLFLLASVVVRYKPDGLVILADGDVADAAAAMAGTLESASRGIIAQLPGSTGVSEGLRRQWDEILAELGKGSGSHFAADAAEVLRSIERGAKHEAEGVGTGDRDFLALLGRILPPTADQAREKTTPSGLILP